jgi:hypothetical protein
MFLTVIVFIKSDLNVPSSNTSESKMRNSLAEDVLNKDILHVMRCYAASLNDSDHLKSTISLLEQTSILIANCRDRRPIREVGDV